MSARRRPPVHSLAFDARTVVGCKMASHMPLVVDDSFVAFYDVGVTIDERWHAFFEATVRRGLVASSLFAQLACAVDAEETDEAKTEMRAKQLETFKIGLALRMPFYVRATGLTSRPDLNLASSPRWRRASTRRAGACRLAFSSTTRLKASS